MRTPRHLAPFVLTVLAGCNDGALPPPEPHTSPDYIWSSSSVGAISCSPNDQILALLRPPISGGETAGCTCSGIGFTDTCTGCAAGTACSPTEGFRCQGEVTTPEPSCAAGQTCCPPGFQESPSGTCRAELPLTCVDDDGCPDGAHCSLARGGVCWWDCKVACAGAECCGAGSTCGCDGRCHVAGEVPDSPIDLNPFEVHPQAVNLPTTGTQESAAQRVVVVQAPTTNGAHAPITVTADRGLRVACQAGAAPLPRPTGTAYQQSCTLDFAQSRAPSMAAWVAPVSVTAPVSNGPEPFVWSVALRSGSGAHVLERRLTVTRGAALPAPTSGDYTGHVRVDGAWIAAAGSVPFVDHRHPTTGSVAVPVTAEVDVQATAVTLTLSDPSRTLSPTGVVSVQWPGGLASPGTPTVRTPGLLASSPSLRWDDASHDLGFAGATRSDSEATLEVTEGLGLTGRFAIRIAGLAPPASRSPVWTVSFALSQRSERNVFAPPTTTAPSLPGTARLQLPIRAAAAVLPSFYGPLFQEWWEHANQIDSVVPATVALDGSKTVMERFCLDTLAIDVFPTQPESRAQFCYEAMGLVGAALIGLGVPTDVMWEEYVMCAQASASTYPRGACSHATTLGVDCGTIGNPIQTPVMGANRYLKVCRSDPKYNNVELYPMTTSYPGKRALRDGTRTMPYTTPIGTEQSRSASGYPKCVQSSGVWVCPKHLPWSREIRTNLLIPPATAGLAYQEDRSELGGASPLDGDAMLAACLADLNRQFPAWLWSSSVADAPDAYHPGDAQAQITPSYSALLDSLFTTAPCHGVFQSVLSVAGFTKHAAGARHAFRALQMWLEAHTFVASAGTQTNDVMETLLAADFASNPETPLPDGEAIDWDRLLDTLESGWWLILHPQVFGFLSSTTIDGYLVAPDYRAEWVQAWHPVFEDADKDPHTAGLAVTILDYAVAHLEADLRFLESVSAELVGAAAGSIEGERSAALARHGEILRYSWLAEALARDIVRRATVANGNTAPPWAPRWEDARVRLGAARDRALAAGSGLAHGQNPLGIEDADLPIYFVDPQGANSRFFAISDYLLTGWARPAVSAAQAALASAREAWLAKRQSEIRERLELDERERRLELIRARYGQVLVDGCGLQMPAEDALTAFEQNVYRIADCSEIQSPQCRSRAEEAIARSQPPASTCPGVSPVWSDPHELYMTRRQICVMARDWAIVTADPSTKKSFMRNWQLLIPPYTSSGWFDPQVDPLIDIMELRVFPLAQTFSGDPGLVPTGVLTANASGGGAFQVPTAWPRLDNLFTEQCGSVLFSITPETTVTFSNLGGQNHQEAVRTWYEAYQKSYRFRKQEHFGAAMDRKIQVLEAWCDDYLMSRADALGGEPHFYDPSALASCYRGELGSTAAEILTANDHVHVALTELRGLERRYETAVRTCLSRSAADETIVAANDRLAVALEELRQLGASASIVTGAVQGIIGGLASENPVSLLGTVFGLGLSSTRERMEKKAAALERNHALMVGLLQAKVGLESCLAEASNVRSAIDTQVAAITVALDNVVQALIRRSNLMTSMENALSDGLAALRREEGRDTTNPGFHYWLDERVETFRREFDWARRLSYMALRALEYEAQSSLPIRHWILGARHPDELAIALREVEREQATRGIDGARPEAGTVVLSTVRDLLGLSDSFNAQLGYGRESARDRLRNKLADGASDVFDERGRYLGKAIDFEVRPEGPLQYRCAERLWSVTAAVEGDLLGARTPTLPLYVLKRNHFASQWCGARGGGEAMQTASVRPTRNLFRGADGSVTQEVVETSTWASVDAWINVKRSELYRDEYRQGSSDELAGRGLYGAYTLILPADGFLDEVSSLTGLEDILIRFDYVSVANPTALVSDPPTIDPVVDEALPRVTDLTAAPSEGRCSLTWTNPADPRLASVRVLGKAGGFPTGPTDAAATVVYEGLTTNASWTTWSWSTQSPIANESYIAAYAHYGGTSYSAPTRGTCLPFFFDYDAGDLSHSHETFEATPTAWNLAVSGDDMDWTRQTGATSSASTGPDGASQGAWYAYIEASSPNFPNKTSIMDVTVASLPTERWISFSWHMYGATIGTLELQYHNGTSWVTVWSKSGDQGNAWFTEGVRLTGYGGSSLSLRFRSVTGTSFTGDTAIDDIRIFGAP